MSNIAEYSTTEAALSELREKYARTYDVGTTAGMDEAKEARRTVKGYRVALEAKRKEIKAPALERCKAIDDEAKRITNELSAIEDPIDATIKAEEQRKEAEKAKVEADKRAVALAALALCNQMRGTVTVFASSSTAEITEVMSSLAAEVIPDNEHWSEVTKVRDEAIAALGRLQAAAFAREAESARMAAERVELERAKAEAYRIEKETTAKLQAERVAENARLLAEGLAMKAKLEAAEAEAKALRDEADRLARLERDRLEAEARTARAEQDRIAAESRRAEEKRLADEYDRLQAEELRQRKERAELEAKANNERVAAEAKAQAERAAADKAAWEIESARVRKLDARAMLAEFVRLYGALPEFADVVEAIEYLDGPAIADEFGVRGAA